MIMLAKRWFSCAGGLLSLVLCGVLPALSNAQVRVVYRYDTRPPQEIFASGFAAPGQDMNLIRHVTGWTDGRAEGDDDGLIATTSEESVARRMAVAHLNHFSDPNAMVFVYAISANHDFFAVMPSLSNFLEQQRAAPAAARYMEREGQLSLVIESYREQQEFVSAAPIPPSAIRWARPISLERDARNRLRPRFGERRINGDWVDDAPDQSANAGHYPVNWPDEPSASPQPAFSLSSCEEDQGASAGPPGVNCTGDLYAAVADDGEVFPRAMLPSCSSAPRPRRAAIMLPCSDAWPLVNISRLARTNAALFPGGDEFLAAIYMSVLANTRWHILLHDE
ncbi:hypothetical protein ABZR86_12245 [Dyella marensis]|uniref:Pertussis toxin, subunit 1 n=1 Tax=Dyella marensis TaxID=500610 RepID=A0A1I2GVF9_9GAMM|nr:MULTISPECIES: hypothetical protein [Dyella]SFF21120.1 Pertussis toxin, subunit 1 [Dyella marensis]